MVREERGVTLVEIIVALAIAGILASTVLFGRDQLRARQQFSQGVDQIVQILAGARQEATGTVGKISSDGGSDKGQFVYAKLVSITNGGSDIRVETETINKTDDPNGTVTQITNPYTVTIPWGVVPTTNKYFLFALQNGGIVSTYYTNLPLNKPTVGSARNGAMIPVSLTGSENFTVRNTSGNMTATITVDQYGNVSRVIN